MKTMNKSSVSPSKRYRILAAGMLAQFCAGIIYMWSVFQKPVVEYLSWDSGAAKLTSSIMLAMFVLGIIAGGFVQDKLGPKKATLIGSCLIGCGMASTSFVTAGAPWLIYITYSIIGGLGVGTVYTSTIAAVQKWFPDKRGFASGMIVSSFGFSLVAFAPLAESMLYSDLGVRYTFLVFGISFLVICSVCAMFISNPPEGHIPAGHSPKRHPSAGHSPEGRPSAGHSPEGHPSTGHSPEGHPSTGHVANLPASTRRQYSPREILKTKQFYLLAGALVFTLPAYFILNPVFRTLGVERGLREEIALLGVMITGISSAAGRLVVSWVSDKTGRKTAMIAIAAMILIASLVMIVGRDLVFLICIVVISFGFGGASGVYSAMTAESFGTKYGGTNFGLVMLGFCASALIFPTVSNSLTAGGSYTSSFIVAAATCVVAMVLVLLMKNPGKQ